MKSEGMSKQANVFFNWYLDGKCDLPSPVADAKVDKKTPAKKGPSEEQIFKQRDKDHNGVVNWEEFLDGRTEKVDILRKNFERRDTNKNDLWEKSEIK